MGEDRDEGEWSGVRIAVAIGLVLVGVALMLLPSPLVADTGRAMSAPAQWHMHRKIAGAVEDGAPCIAIAVGYSQETAEQLVSETMPAWQAECESLGAKNHTPVVIRVSHKSGGVNIDVDGAREAGFVFEPAQLRAARDEAGTEIGIEHYEATAWLALTEILGESEPVPAYMAARGRPVRSLVRGMGLISMVLLVAVALIIAVSKPGSFRGRPWFNGSAPSPSSPSPQSGIPSPPSPGNSRSVVEDDE